MCVQEMVEFSWEKQNNPWKNPEKSIHKKIASVDFILTHFKLEISYWLFSYAINKSEVRYEVNETNMCDVIDTFRWFYY